MFLKSKKNILWLKDISLKDVPLVGGKNASLGEMYRNLSKKEINVPDGFALTTRVYWRFLKDNADNADVEGGISFKYRVGGVIGYA